MDTKEPQEPATIRPDRTGHLLNGVTASFNLNELVNKLQNEAEYRAIKTKVSLVAKRLHHLVFGSSGKHFAR